MQEFDTETGTLPATDAQARHDQRSARMFARIKHLVGLPAGQRLRLLDVGCSTGALMLSARREGIDVTGVEPAVRAAGAAQAAGLTVYAGTLAEAALPSLTFHAATLIEVIEHLTKPGEVLREIRRILVPGGVLVIGTGNAASWTVRLMGGGWDYFQVGRHGGHISFFTPESLRRLAVRCGFQVERIETRHVRFVESYQAPKPVYRALKIIAEVLNVPARWTDKGHDMLMYLRKVG
jgi:2-polyprenyl-3-methyl-5-hydroxy-6-metoxy-1,4-benzoquinol methylase